MKLRIAMFAFALIACGDNGKTPKDASVQDASADAPLYPACGNVVRGTAVRFRRIAQVDARGAVLATSPPSDPRLFVVEQHGAIRLIKDDVLQPQPFIDLSAEAGGPVVGGRGGGDEAGLVGLAFHPQYATNRLFFLIYNSSNGDFYQNIVRCRANDNNPDSADPASCVPLISFRHFNSNHEGGMAEFGRDGYLYVSLGDGGGGGDAAGVDRSDPAAPYIGNGQNPNTLLGKMLRIDVDRKAAGKEYGIPDDNPYAQGGGAPEIFMRGLRNPWRWSFDRGTGDMWICDVGQELAEEVNVLRPGEQRGANLGWSIYEGNYCCGMLPFHCQTPAEAAACSPVGITFPKKVYEQPPQGVREWQSIIAGEVYRGSCFPDLYGWFYYTDWERRELTKARIAADGSFESYDVGVRTPEPPSSLHADSRGELVLTTTLGGVFRLEVAPQ